MSELKPCPFCGSMAVVKCRVDSDWGVDLKYRLINDESNYDIKSMIAIESYDPDYQSGDYWDIEIFRCQSCRAEWGEGTDVCVAELKSRIAELEEKQRWIPVDEKPLEVGVYFVRLKNGLTKIDWTFIDGGIYYWWNSGQDSVTHYMPLPHPPEVQESEATACKFCGSDKSDRRMNSIVCSGCGRKIGNVVPPEVQE
jgi:hypothetical protein